MDLDRPGGGAISALEEALTLVPADAGTWTANADPRFESINGMFGGWAAAVLLRATLQRPDEGSDDPWTPVAITVNFLGKVEPGTNPVVSAETAGGGRSLRHWQARLLGADDDRVLASAMVILARRAESDGFLEPQMPVVPDPDTLDEFHPPGSQGARVLIRPISGHPPFNRMRTASSAWVRDLTGRPPDHVQLAYLADSYAPRIFFHSVGPRASATMTLSVYFHGSPEEIAAVGDGYVLNEAVGTRASSSISGQHARLWNASGALLATTEQLCWFR